MKFIVSQIGARRGYAVPDILARAGMLERFYTDLAGNVGVGRILSALPLLNGRFRALAGRRVPETIRAKTATRHARPCARARFARGSGNLHSAQHGKNSWLGRCPNLIQAHEKIGNAGEQILLAA
jgi:hypothetical protein